MTALNVETENATLNAKRKRDMMALYAKLKMQGDNEREICPSVACRYNSQSTRRGGLKETS